MTDRKSEKNIPFPPPFFYDFTFIDLFSGIGGFRIAFQDLGGRCVFSSEIDEQAQYTYFLNFGDLPEGDITKISSDRIPDHDILLGGFPCQAFSIAGRRAGFNDTRGTLFFEIARILKDKRPRAFILENVKGLVHHDKGKTLDVILQVLRNDLGYYVPDPALLNAKNFGLPQNRERIFIVGFRDIGDFIKFEYPRGSPVNSNISQILEKNKVSPKYYLSNVYLSTLRKHKERHRLQGHGFGYEIISPEGVANTIVIGGMGKERNLVKDWKCGSMTPVTKIKGEINGEGIRRMTPREWARLQGFPDKFIIGVSDAAAYRQFANAVAVPVAEAVGRKVIESLEKHHTGTAEADSFNGEEKKMFKGNKGEWSEIYVFLRAMADGKIHLGDPDLKVILDRYLTVISILRKENNNKNRNYTRDSQVIVTDEDGKELTHVTIAEFRDHAIRLFKQLSESQGSSFSFTETEKFLRQICVESLKADSRSKCDITIKVHDSKTNLEQLRGFSIKSFLGGSPTLLNPGSYTNFVFSIDGNLNDSDIIYINSLQKVSQRVQEIIKRGAKLKFVSIAEEKFQNNLDMLNPDLAKILANLLVLKYSGNGSSSLEFMCSSLDKDDPLHKGEHLSKNHYYTVQMKRFLLEIAMGMTPGKEWTGSSSEVGGYIVVKNSGDIVCYDMIERTIFEDYLIRNTYLDTPSTTRYNFGNIYGESGVSLRINLNLQIRFK